MKIYEVYFSPGFDSQVVGVLVVGDDPGHLPVPRRQVSDLVLIRSELRGTQTKGWFGDPMNETQCESFNILDLLVPDSKTTGV